jgi:hypothetical protein
MHGRTLTIRSVSLIAVLLSVLERRGCAAWRVNAEAVDSFRRCRQPDGFCAYTRRWAASRRAPSPSLDASDRSGLNADRTTVTVSGVTVGARGAAKVANQRKDFHHQQARALVGRDELLVVGTCALRAGLGVCNVSADHAATVNMRCLRCVCSVLSTETDAVPVVATSTSK